MNAPKRDPDLYAAVGHYRPIKDYISNGLYGDAKELKADALREGYSGYRTIRGDGDCYYRAVMYSYMEKLIELSGRQLKDFSALLESPPALFNIKREGEDVIDTLKKHVDTLIAIKETSGAKAALKMFFDEVNNERSSVDRALIRFLRSVTYNFFRLHSGVKNAPNGMSLGQVVKMCTNPDYEEFLARTVLGDGQHAITPIDMVVPLALRIAINVVVVNADKKKEVPVQRFEAEVRNEFKLVRNDSLDLHENTLYVMLSPGHYQIVYPARVTDGYDGGLLAAGTGTEKIDGVVGANNKRSKPEPEAEPAPKKEEKKKENLFVNGFVDVNVEPRHIQKEIPPPRPKENPEPRPVPAVGNVACTGVQTAVEFRTNGAATSQRKKVHKKKLDGSAFLLGVTCGGLICAALYCTLSILPVTKPLHK